MPAPGPPYGAFHWIAGILALVAYSWFPGFVLLRFFKSEDESDDSVFRIIALPLAVSPIVATTITILVCLAGVSFRVAAWIPIILSALLFLVPRKRGGDVRSKVHDRDLITLAIFTTALVAVVYLLNPWLRWRADGRFHIGVVAEILRGGLPPNDPFFTGLDLQYMWFFHAYVAALRSLSGASTAALLSFVNVAAAGAFVLQVGALSRGLGKTRREGLIAAILVVFAMGGLGWIFFPVKMLGAFTGTVRGLDEIRGLLDFTPPQIGRYMAFFAIWMDQPFFLRKFLVGTAMSLALLAFVLNLDMSRRLLFKGGVGRAVLTALSAAGAIVLHPMMGIPGVAAVCAATLLLAAWDRARPFAERVGAGNAALVIGANVAGVVAALPYMMLVTHGKEGAAGLPVAILPAKIISLAAGSIGVGVPAIAWIRSALRGGRLSRNDAWALAWSAMLIGFSLFVRFPLEIENIDKPTLLVHLPLAILGGWGLARWLESGRRRAALVFLLLSTIPLNLVVLSGYVLEKDPRTYRTHEKEAFRFVAREADPMAVVFDSQDRDRPAVEIQRRQWWSHEQFAATHEYPVAEMNARRALRDALYNPSGPSAEDAARLRAIGAPVYVIVRAGAAVPGAGFPPGRGNTAGSFAAGDADPLAASPELERVFDSDDVRVYRLR